MFVPNIALKLNNVVHIVSIKDALTSVSIVYITFYDAISAQDKEINLLYLTEQQCGLRHIIRL